MTPSDKRFVKMKQLNQKHKHKASKKTLEKRINETQCCDCKKTQQKKLFSVNQWSKKRPTCRECICTIVVEEKRIAKEKSLLKKCHKIYSSTRRSHSSYDQFTMCKTLRHQI